MTRFRISLLSLLVAAVALSAGCGGGGASSSLKSDDVAVVGDLHITKDQLDHQITLKLQSAKVDKQTVPKPGSATYRTQVVDPVVSRLVTEAQIENIATELKVTVSDNDVQKALDAAVKQQFAGDTAKYKAFLKKYGITEADIKEQVIRPSLLQTKIQDKVKAEYPITDAQVKDYFDSHKTQFITPDTRQVHYLIASSKADATAARSQLAGGADWGTVYKKFSLDYKPGTPAAQIGKLSVSKGQGTEANFTTAVFGGSLKTNELSGLIPVSKPYADSNLPGKCKPTCYFLVRPDSAIVKGSDQTLAQAKASIESTLASSVQGPKISKRLQQLIDEQKKITKYADAYKPATPTNPSTTGGGTT
jgi:hypothetical protein